MQVERWTEANQTLGPPRIGDGSRLESIAYWELGVVLASGLT